MVNKGNSLRFNALGAYLQRGSASLAALTTGAIELVTAVGKNITLTANAVIVSARTGFAAATAQTVAAGTTIQPSGAVVEINSSGNVTMTSTPTIADGFDGQELLLINTDTTDTITIQDNGTLANSGLRLTATTVALGPLDSIRLRYIASLDRWVQVGPLVNIL